VGSRFKSGAGHAVNIFKDFSKWILSINKEKQMTNVYYSPEYFDLSIVGTAELEEGCYSFYTLCVWKGASGFYLATDSGCSCPSPFENYNGVDDLTGPLSAAQAIEEATSLWTQAGAYDPEDFHYLMKNIS
jgi:hypothetical protein